MAPTSFVSATHINNVSSVFSVIAGGIIGYLSDLPEGVLICAVFGATFYIVLNQKLSRKRQLFFFCLSFYLGTSTAASLMAVVLTHSLSKVGIIYVVDESLGALVVSAGGVSILLIVVKALQAFTQKQLSGKGKE